MAVPIKTHTWITLWFLITTPLVIWDAGYCFMRPRSMRGGDLHWIWKPYSIYQDVDLVYGVQTYERGDGFVNAQALLNLVETFLNLLYVYLAHVASNPAAPIIGFASVNLTLGKTVLYMLQDLYCDRCFTGHNDLKTLIQYYLLPDGCWIVFPALIIYQLGKDMASSLNVAHKAANKKYTGKAN